MVMQEVVGNCNYVLAGRLQEELNQLLYFEQHMHQSVNKKVYISNQVIYRHNSYHGLLERM